MTKVYIHYVEDSSPKFKIFTSVKTAKLFADKFRRNNPEPDRGSWIEFIIKGELMFSDDYYKVKKCA